MIFITPELAEICGIHAGDGYLRKRENKIELDLTGHVEEKEYYDNHIIPLFNKVFNLNLKARTYSKGTYGFVITNNQFKIFNELDFPYGKKSKIVRIPDLILKSKNKILYARFLRGLFDTDGNLYFKNRKNQPYTEFKRKHNYYPIISITTISKLLSKDISFILEKLRIKHYIFGFQPKDERDSYKYRIMISGTHRLKKWMKLVGIKNPVKLTRYLIWKKFDFCPPHTTFEQRKNILNGELDLYSIGPIV